MSDQAQPLLFELGCEELPAGPQVAMAEELGQRLIDGLDALGISRGEHTVYATPRRLAVLIDTVAARQPDRAIEKRGPSVKAPEKAVAGFARSCGVEADALETIATDKGDYYVFRGQQSGQALAELLPALITESVKKLTTPKRMRWGNGTEAFLRPVQWLVLLHGNAVLPLTLFGLQPGRTTQGHRFHAPFAIELSGPADYADTLFEAQVLASHVQRREIISQQVAKAASRAGGRAQMSDDLLDEVTALVEWPVAIVGKIDASFMALPPEVLITTIESHQRYFPVLNADGGLMPLFCTVANIESTDMAKVITGNERVVRPRLDDALFFWNKDRKQALADYAPKLADVTFQKGLGSYADKAARIADLAEHLAPACGADAQHARRAGALAKADLVTDMVFEMTELEGIMGGYYARESGEPDAVAAAISEHYQPRGPSDDIPATPEGRAVALADKLDTLVGQFALGNKPTGDRDPLGLRRAALGVLRILSEATISLDLSAAIASTLAAQPANAPESTQADVVSFVNDRLKGLAAELGLSANVFSAVAALEMNDPTDALARMHAVAAFESTPAAASLAAGHKRVRNLLKKADDAVAPLDPTLFEAEAESVLHANIHAVSTRVRDLASASKYADALAALAELQGPVDRFFDDVMIMADDEAIRNNRLALLAEMDALFRHVADFSHLSV